MKYTSFLLLIPEAGDAIRNFTAPILTNAVPQALDCLSGEVTRTFALAAF